MFNLHKFSKETLNDFVEFSNENWEEKWLINVDCQGGFNFVAYQIIDIVSRKQRLFGNVELNIVYAGSNGFRFIMEFEGIAHVLRGATGMIHMSSESVDVFVDGTRQDKHDGNRAQVMEETDRILVERDREFFKRFLSKQQFRDYKAGRDVWFTEPELVELLKKRF